MSFEYCDVCEEPTGRAGAGEDSLFLPNGDGPFCEQCWDSINEYAKKRRTKKLSSTSNPEACIRFEYMSWVEREEFWESQS